MTPLSKAHQTELLALILLNQNVRDGALFFSKCPVHTQIDLTTLLISHMDTLTNTESLIQSLNASMAIDLSSICLNRFSNDQFMSILQHSEMATIELILQGLSDPYIIKNLRQFIFKMEYLPNLTDSAVEMIMRELIPSHLKASDLPWLLNGCHTDVINKVLKNVSKRNAQDAREQLERIHGSNLDYTQKLQSQLIQTAIKLEQYGCLNLWHGPVEPIYVPLTVHDFDHPSGDLLSLQKALEVFTTYSDHTIQRILREIDNVTLLPLLAAGSDLFWETIMNQCSTRLSEMLSEDTKEAVLQHRINLSDVHESFESLKKLTEKLLHAGEIECRPTAVQPRRP